MLTLGEEHSFEVAPGGEAVFQLEIGPSHLVHLELVQHDVDLAVALFAPQGNRLWRSDFTSGRDKVEEVWAISEEAGPHRLVVSATGEGGGHATVRFLAHRTATPADRRLVTAERNLVDAATARRGGERQAMEAALPGLAAAAAFFTDSGDTLKLGRALRKQVQLLTALGRADEARGPARRAIEVARRADDPFAESASWLDLSVSSWALGDYAAALEEARACLELARVHGLERRRHEAEKNISLYLGLSGDLRGALASSRRLAAAERETGDRRALAYELNNQGTYLHRLGDNLAALDAWREAASLFDELGLERQAATVLSNQGSLSTTLGDTAAARPLLRRSLELRRRLGDVAGQASSHANLAATDLTDGDELAAAGQFLRAEGLYRRAGNRWGELHCRAERGLALEGAGRRGEARKALESAREQAIEAGYGRIEATARLGLARLHVAGGDRGGATRELDAALTLTRRLEAPYQRAEIRFELARLEADFGFLDAALTHARDAVTTAESLRRRAGSDGLKAAFLSKSRRYYDLWLELLFRRGGDGDAAAAFAVAERARARSLLDHVVDLRSAARARLDPQLADREIAADHRLAGARGRLEEARHRGAGGPEVQSLQQELREALGAVESLRGEIRRRHPDHAIWADPEPRDAASVGRLLRPEEALVLFHVGEAASFRFVLTRDGLEADRLPGGAELASQVEGLRRLMSADRRRSEARLAQRGRHAFDVLLGAAWPRLAAKHRLWIVADGPLLVLPFETLVTPGPPSTARLTETPFLVRTHEVGYALSATLWAEAATRGHSRASPAPRDRHPPLELVAFADVGGGPPATDMERSAGSDASTEPLAPLAASGEEVAALAALFPAERTLILRGSVDGADELRRREIAGARYLHFATHATLDPEMPARSALVLDPSSPRGRLTVGDIAGLRLDSELVTLAACETGLGKRYDGEGLMGLARAFFFAGTPRLVASLWPVSDRATSELMGELYRQLRTKPEEPAAALRAAKLALLDRPDRAQPFYWAPFILLGAQGAEAPPVPTP